MELQKLAVEELRRVFDQYAESAQALDVKAASLLLVGSVVIGYLLLSPLPARLAVAAFMLGYLGLVTACIKALLPREYKNAIATNWESLYTHLLQKNEEEAYRTLISTYLASIEANKRANLEKVKYVNIAAVMFILIIVEIVVTVVQSVWLVW